MAISTPMVNAPYLNIDGMNMSWVSATSIIVTAGRTRDGTNLNDIILPANATINALATGANGLDIGALANNTFYAVYAIGSSYSSAPPATILSANLASPLLPSDYDMSRRIGYVLTSGAAAILQFYQVGTAEDRWMWYDAGIQELAAGASAVYAAVNLTSSVPPEALMVMFDVLLTPTAAADAVHLQPPGATAADGYAILSGAVAGVVQRAPLIAPCNGVQVINYKVTGTVTLNVRGYLDMLSL